MPNQDQLLRIILTFIYPNLNQSTLSSLLTKINTIKFNYTKVNFNHQPNQIHITMVLSALYVSSTTLLWMNQIM